MARTYSRDHDVRFARCLLNDLGVVEGAYDGLNAKALELLRLDWVAEQGSNAERGRLRMFEEASKNSATNVALQFCESFRSLVKAGASLPVTPLMWMVILVDISESVLSCRAQCWTPQVGRRALYPSEKS